MGEQANRVTAIERPRRGSPSVDIYIDGEFWRTMNKSVAERAGVKAGLALHTDHTSRTIDTEEDKVAEDIALRLLTYRPRSVAEIRTRLTDSGLGPESVGRLIDRFTRSGYLDDSDFARAWIDERTRVKRYGRRRIASELIARGVDQRLFETELDAFCPDEDEPARAEQLLLEKYPDGEQLMEPDAQRRAYQWLARRGFGSGAARTAIRCVAHTETGE